MQRSVWLSQLLLPLLLLLPTPVANAQVTRRLIVSTGATLPDRAGTFGGIGPAVINSAGQVAFFASEDTGTTGAWIAEPNGTLRRLFSEGDSVVGPISSDVVGNLLAEAPLLDGSGGILVRAGFTHAYAQPGGGLISAGQQGQACSPTTFSFGFNRVRLTDSGIVMFDAYNCGREIPMGGTPGTIEFIAPLDASIAGFDASVRVASVRAVAQNDSGDSWFYAHACDTPTCTGAGDIGLVANHGGTLSAIHASGDPVQGAAGLVLYDVLAIAASDGGGIACVTQINTAGLGDYTPSLAYSDGSSPLELIIRQGDPIPGLPGATFRDSFGDGQLRGLDFLLYAADDGSVVFWANLFGSLPALLRWTRAGGVTVIAKDGISVPGVGHIDQVGGFAVSPNGRVALTARLMELPFAPGTGVFVENAQKELVLAISTQRPYDFVGSQPITLDGVATGGSPATSVTGYGTTGTGADGRRMYFNAAGDLVVHGSPATFVVNVDGGPPPVMPLIVNSQGDLPQSGAPSRCDTGQTVPGGDPECTLRAAIQVANTRGASASIHFALPNVSPIATTSALPSVDVPIEIAGDDGQTVVIQPATSAGSGDGLTLTGASSTLRNLAIRNFSGDGVSGHSDPLTVSGCKLSDNGGWGVHNESGRIVVEAAATQRSEIARNGKGGVLAVGTAVPELMLASADVHDNVGAGVVSNGNAEIAASTVKNNLGPGVAILDGPGPIPLIGVAIVIGGDGSPTEISANQGEGILTLRGGVKVSGPATVSDNAAWGVNAFGQLYFGEQPVLPAYRMTVANNGAGSACFDIGLDVASIASSSTPCRGGGLLSPHASSGSSNVLSNVDIRDNAGPGVLVRDPTTIAAVNIVGNKGPGLKRDFAGDAGIDSQPGVIVSFNSTLVDNAGYGIESTLGYVSIQVASELRGNHGAGIRTQSSRVELATANNGATGRTVIAENGAGDCTVWDITANDEATPSDRACELGGINAPNNRVYAIAVDVIDNQGDGISAESVDLHDVKICGNSGEPLVVAGMLLLDAVDTCAAGGGADGSTEEDSGGCVDVGGEKSMATVLQPALLMLLVLILRRRHRGG